MDAKYPEYVLPVGEQELSKSSIGGYPADLIVQGARKTHGKGSDNLNDYTVSTGRLPSPPPCK